MCINVVKRDESVAPLDKDKIMAAIDYCSEGLEVNPQVVYMNAKLEFYDNIPTSAIHRSLVRSASDLINEYQADYQILAGRLELMQLRKEVYSQWEPTDLYSHVRKVTELGKYHSEILDNWSERDFDYFNRRIKHERDMNYTHAAILTFKDKYAVQDRVKDLCYETPQTAYMLKAMCTFQNYPKSKRKDYVMRWYDILSLQKFSLPSPVIAGVRTPQKQYSSCMLITAGDSLESINATSSAIVKYVSQKAGIGLNFGRIRAMGSPIRDGQAFHTGVIPFVKHFQTAIKSCSMGGMRNGAGTLYFPLWHMDAESFIVLKNDKGTEDTRARHVDYAVQMNRLMYRKIIANESLNLFCPNDVPDLYEAFFVDNDKFDELYEKYSADENIRRKVVNTQQHFLNVISERSGTGRIYIHNADHCNTHGPFDPATSPIYQANLCVEAILPTKPLVDVNSDEGEIALCTLGAINLANTTVEEFPEVCDIAVRAIDALFDYQEYPVKAAEKAKQRRSIGVGVINFAHWLAKQGYKYSDREESNQAVHELMEAVQYNLLNASADLAGEQGACGLFNETKYAKGLLPIDWYNKNVDNLCDGTLLCDWEGLREKIAEYGLRNSVLTAIMPSETSSIMSGATNGIEPIKSFSLAKTSKATPVTMVYPDVVELSESYEKQWDMPNNKGYLEKCAIIQKFVDQGVSVNTNYDPRKYPKNLVSKKEILEDIITYYQNGGKSMYYHNTYDMKGEDVKVEEACEGGSCQI